MSTTKSKYKPFILGKKCKILDGSKYWSFILFMPYSLFIPKILGEKILVILDINMFKLWPDLGYLKN